MLKGIAGVSILDALKEKTILKFIEEANVNNYAPHPDLEPGIQEIINADLKAFRNDEDGTLSRVYIDLTLLLNDSERIDIVLEDEFYGEGFYYVW